MQTNLLNELVELFSAAHLIKIALVLAAAWGAARVLRLLLERLAQKFNRYRLQITGVFPVLRLAIWTGAVAVILFVILHPSKNVVLAVLASSGIAVGLAAQDLIRNVLAGIGMTFKPLFRVGDMVQIGEHYGEVAEVDLIVTNLRTFEDNVVAIPNAEVIKQPVSNANRGALVEMVVVEFVLPAGVPVQRVKSLAWRAAVSSPYTFLKKPIEVLVEDHFDYTFLSRFKVKAYVLDIRFERLMASDITERLKTLLHKERLLPGEYLRGTTLPQQS